jgi:hypothetical protein
MLRSFIKECLLWGSDETLIRVLGILAWVSVAMFMYAIVSLIRSCFQGL